MDPQQLAAVRRLVVAEGTALAGVRSRAEQTTTPPSAEVGGLLRFVAAAGGARHAVEFGAAGGVSTVWLVEGMGVRGVLTSIEPDTHLHGLVTAAVEDTGIGDRVRSINGDPVEISGRLSDGQYDLVLLQGDPAGQAGLLPQAERLLRPGGTLVVRRVLATGDADSPVLEATSADPWVDATVLPLDDGLLLARLRAEQQA